VDFVRALSVTVGCLTPAPLRSRPRPLEVGHPVALELDAPAPLKAEGALRGSSFDIRVRLRASNDAPTWDSPAVEIASYVYRVNARQGHELLAFHWHPESTSSPVHTPHLHVSSRLIVPTPRGDPDALELGKLHLPTGHVSLPAVVRMLIEEFAVRPLTPTWQARLTEAEATLRGRPDER